MIKLLDANKYGEKSREEALRLMPITAEQILLQVTAAKSHLDLESAELKNQDIRSIVQDASLEAKYSLPSFEKMDFQTQIPNDPVLVAYDAKLIRRAIGNLVNNAFSACQEQVKVILEATQNGIQIQVHDDGPGLSQSDAGLYLQGRKKSTKGDRQAFGLSAANHIARIHGGKIIYRPSPLGGACFEIRI
jgi:K+-sensing histidine kinase KdpD